ncbi:MAG: hypothetical protein HN919_05025 [Verrucomicrobia bacterium]|nr:hypothetical protein [Verrucomicrobiota bacterium]MBT7065642.1 hypothetical protein [Verrucomicrobiota bacterium]
MRFARWWQWAFLSAAVLYAVVLIVSRLLISLPFIVDPLTLVVIPLISLPVAWLGYRRVSPSDGARAIDKAEGTSDLFLTAVLIEEGAPEFSELVTSDAAQRVGQVKPRRVVPWDGRAEALRCVAAVVVLWAGVAWLPQLDPFGHVEQREQQEARREELSQTRQVTQLRKARIATKLPSGKLSEETELRIEELKKTFVSMNPGQPKNNFKALTQQQQELGKSWQRTKHSSAALGALPRLDQAFGAQSPRTEQWSKQLAQGDAEGMKQELRELGDMARKLAEMPDGEVKRKLEREMKRRLEELSRFANDKMAARALAASLERALTQMKMGDSQELSQEAMEALAESLNLSEMELSQLQQSMDDLKALEEALRTLQMAQQCNQQQALDGEACTNAASLSDYAAMYEQMLAQQGGCGACEGCLAGTGCTGGGGAGQGMGGPGTGEGGEAPEDDSLETDHVSETSRSAMRAGKILMQWQTDESADRGRAAADYDRQIRDLREGISEAVLNEGVPPVYHDTIRRYFDSLAGGEEAAALPEEEAP